MKKILVIGAGIHGVSVAIEMAQKGFSVTIIDANSEILMGTSNGTHNRVNMGYHYPRSIETAKECLRGCEFFKRNLPFAIYYPEKSFYLIEKNNSKVNSDQYKNFLTVAGLKYSETKIDENLLYAKNIESSFLVDEPCYDVYLLRKYYNQMLKNYSVNIVLNFNIKSIETKDKYYKINSSIGHNIIDDFSSIVNATYANSNKIQSFLGVQPKHMRKYQYQKTEVVVVESKEHLPAITVMDGPFITILPYAYNGHSNKYLIYDVENSIIERTEDSNFISSDYFKKIEQTNYHKMKVKGMKYFKFMKKLTPLYSLQATRPIPLDSYKTDYRHTTIKKHKKFKSCYSILEGKFVSAPAIAVEVCEKIMDDLL
jgi:hypothetical protein